MDFTVLSFEKLRSWKNTNHVFAPMILDASTIEHAVIFPAVFTHMATAIEGTSTPHKMVQVVTFAELESLGYINQLVNSNIPMVVIVFKIKERLLNTEMVPSIFEVLKDRQQLIDRWDELRRETGDKNTDFVTQAESMFATIASQLHIGNTSSLTIRWQELIRKEISTLSNAGSRFLAMNRLVPELAGEIGLAAVNNNNAAPQTVKKRAKIITSYVFGENLESSIALPPDVQTERPANPADSENPDPTSDLEIVISAMRDPLSLFLRYAQGTYGSAVSKLYNKKPTGYANYTSWERVLDYCESTRPWVLTALRRVQAEADEYSRKYTGRAWSILSVLQHKDSDMFFQAARLCGLMMRESELQQVTRGNRTLNDMTKHLRDYNDASIRLIRQIKKFPNLGTTSAF